MPKSAKQSKALEVQEGMYIWDGVVKVLEVDLFSAAWEVRHGAAMALRELLKLQGKLRWNARSVTEQLWSASF